MKLYNPRKPLPEKSGDITAVRVNIARALIGKTVDLLADKATVAHGIVAGVLIEAGMPKVIVNGLAYRLNQVLTVTA